MASAGERIDDASRRHFSLGLRWLLDVERPAAAAIYATTRAGHTLLGGFFHDAIILAMRRQA